MEPIISPWIFYWIDICDKINRTAIGLNSCLCVGGFLVIAWYFMDDEHPAEWEKNKLKKNHEANRDSLCCLLCDCSVRAIKGHVYDDAGGICRDA